MKKKLILIDGSALAYRSYFALIRNPLINSRGENTGAVYGFTSSLFKLLDKIQPDYIACVFDTPAPTFRHELYADYKSTRAKMPEDLVDSLPWIKEILYAFNIPVIEMPGFEADDVIGTLAVKASKTGIDVGIFTGDKDYYQLVNDNIKILDPKTLQWYDAAAVVEKIGIPPDKIIDYLALMGDHSDNIPGVPGVGEKTALELIKEFGGLSEVLESASKIKKKKIAEAVAANADLARLSYRLATIDRHVAVEFDPVGFQTRQPDRSKLAALFKRFEFNMLLNKITDSVPISHDSNKKEVEYNTVDSLEKLAALLEEALKAGECAIDTETTAVDPMRARLVGVSISYEPGRAWYVPVGHEDCAGNLPLAETLGLYEKFFQKAPRLVGHNLKFDRQVFSNHSLAINDIYFDTMIASYVLDPGRRSHSLAVLAEDFFGCKMQPITELIGTGAGQKSFSKVPIDKAAAYSAEDADMTLRLKKVLLDRLEEQSLDRLFFNLEMPLLPVLGDMEKTGVAIDCEVLSRLSKEYSEKMSLIEQQIYHHVGFSFNINSPVQLRRVLFDRLNLQSARKTAKGGEKSTDVGVLEKLALIHPVPKLVLEYRQLAKLKSTYIDALPKLINPQTGRVHTSFNQTVTVTGRLSSSDPNLQNIPIRTEEGREIRRAFVASPGYRIMSADYSQIELRLMAHFAGDMALIESFRRGEDIHRRTAAEVFGVRLEDVTDSMRRSAKTANFAIIYGVSAYGLSRQSELGVKGAQDYIDAYFDRYPGVKRYMEEIKESARRKGFVETLLKRRRYLPDINSQSRQAREFAERTAINTPIQGTAADLIKIAMIRIARNLEHDKKQSKMILQVHDELVFEQKSEEREYLQNMVKAEMEGALELKVPIKVDMGEGDNWFEAH